MTEPRFRILSIDGGGIKGVFPASFLSTLEEHVEAPVGRYFDLIAGTSTGGIIALGLAIGLSAKEILGFYEAEGPKIFPNGNGLRRRIAHWFRPKYDSTPLREALERVFGDSTIGDCQTRILIPSFNAVTGDIYIFKTPHHQRLMTDTKVRLVDVALATTAAPSYFPLHISRAELPMIDGGIWANNPTGLAVVEAISMVGIARERIEVLSLGCTEAPSNFEFAFGGKLRWAKKAIQAAMLGQSFAALGTAKLLIGNPHIHRFSPSVPAHEYELDRPSTINSLKGLGYHHGREALPILLNLFFATTAVPLANVRSTAFAHASSEEPASLVASPHSENTSTIANENR